MKRWQLVLSGIFVLLSIGIVMIIVTPTPKGKVATIRPILFDNHPLLSEFSSYKNLAALFPKGKMEERAFLKEKTSLVQGFNEYSPVGKTTVKTNVPATVDPIQETVPSKVPTAASNEQKVWNLVYVGNIVKDTGRSYLYFKDSGSGKVVTVPKEGEEAGWSLVSQEKSKFIIKSVGGLHEINF